MSNVLATPRFWNTQAVLLKAGVTLNTDSVPTGAANWFEARNVTLTSFEPETVDRNIVQAYFGRSGKIITCAWAKISFEIALAASGIAGTAPKWSPGILACGFAGTNVPVTSDTYNLITSAAGFADLYMNIDGVLYKFISARGNVKCKTAAKGIAVLSFDLTSIFTIPITSAMFNPITKTGWPTELGVNSVNTGKVTINAVDMAFSNLEWDAGNEIAKINLPGPQLEAAITGRQPTASITVLAPALSVFDPYTLANAETNIALTNTHGTVAGQKCKTDLKVVITNVKEDQIEKMLAYNLTLEPTPVSGNDEITLTCL